MQWRYCRRKRQKRHAMALLSTPLAGPGIHARQFVANDRKSRLTPQALSFVVQEHSVKGQGPKVKARRGGGCRNSTGPERPTAESSAETFVTFMVRIAVAAHAAQRRAYSQHPRQTAGPEGPATEANAELRGLRELRGGSCLLRGGPGLPALPLHAFVTPRDKFKEGAKVK
jgi:hypothetical protein